jgi:AraC family transcriptional regulator
MSIEPIRFVDDPGKLFAGIRRVHTYRDASTGIPAQWREFQSQMATMPGRVGRESYGVMCANFEATQSFEYMCAVQIASFDAIASTFGRMRVKPQRYAVFEHEGHISRVHATWAAIWNDWIPRSGLRAVEAPEFEVYTEAFDPASGQGGVEIWCAVAEKSAAPSEPSDVGRSV